MLSEYLPTYSPHRRLFTGGSNPAAFSTRSNLSDEKTQLLPFIVASFVFVLNYRHRGTMLDYTPQSRHGIKVFNPQQSLHAQNSLSVLWYSWSNLLSVLFFLTSQRCSVSVLASSPLSLFAQAVSWYTFTGTYLQ